MEFIAHRFIDTTHEFRQGSRIIKVHNIFKECPIEVAAAIVEIFMDEDCAPECIGIIENHVKEKLGIEDVKIQPPKATMTELVKKVTDTDCSEKRNNGCGKEELYIEADISTIDVTNVKGECKRINDNGVLMLDKDDILELDIVARPSLHKKEV